MASCRRRARCAILAPGAVTAPRTPARMYITDARHFLDEKGAIAARRGPAKVMADFHAGVIACAADFEDTGVLTPTCFKCKKAGVRIALAEDDAILWSCPRCTARRSDLELARHALGSERALRAWLLNRGVKPWHCLAADFSSLAMAASIA